MDSDYRVAWGVPGDGQAISALKRRCFSADYLVFSIYQAAESAGHIERLLLHQPPSPGGEIIRVARRDGVIAGYYFARVIERAAHLSYIATEPREAGRGVGTLLMRDLEAVARSCGGTSLSLDVFSTNARPLEWYRRAGFRETGQHVYAVLDLHSAGADQHVIVSPERLANAIRREATDGFAKIELTLGSATVVAGMLAGKRVRLLDDDGIGVCRFAKAAANVFPDRRELVVLGTHGDMAGVRVLRREHSIHMCKDLDP